MLAHRPQTPAPPGPLVGLRLASPRGCEAADGDGALKRWRCAAGAADAFPAALASPPIALRGVAVNIRIELAGDATDPVTFVVRQASQPATEAERWELAPGSSVEVPLTFATTGVKELRLESQGVAVASATVRAVPGYVSLLPPLVAIIAAVLLRQVLVSLFAGIWLGALFIYDFNPLVALLRTADRFVVSTVANVDNATIIVFTLLLGGMVGVIVRNGGTHGLVQSVVRWATSARSGQVSTWLMGLMIFFDDYTNTLIVGNAMRPVTDRLRISREKLAYLVDCTAAPVASIALISSWIGVEVGYIDGALRSVGSDRSAYLLFVESIPYRFYPVLAIVFAFMVSYMNRDFGPMLQAERRARLTGKVLSETAKPLADVDSESSAPLAGVPLRWYNAVVPILFVVIGTFAGMWVQGTSALVAAGADVLAEAAPYEVLAAASPNLAILWGALLGSLAAVSLSVGQRILSLEDTLAALVSGMKSMVHAIAILVLAWSLKDVCAELLTADYLVDSVSGNLPARLLPVLVFLIAAGVSFSTGTSYGAMGILMPLVVPVAVQLAELASLSATASNSLLLGAVSSVLAGSVWGDHCSPISDTTILSSMASGSDHIDHVRTQIPYAVTVALVGMLVGDIPTAYGLHPLISYAIAIPLLWAILRYFGRRTETTSETNASPES